MSALDPTWHKSTRSNNNGACVEVRLDTSGQVQVRDSKADGTGPVLGFASDAWAAFVAAIRGGDLA